MTSSSDAAPAPGAASAPGLYVHVPYCSAICPYCDFAVVKDDPAARSRFVPTLLREARIHAAIDDWRFDTVYLGGGTPSALEPAQLAELLGGLREVFDGVEGARVYLEANPEDVSRESVRAWRGLGVTTLSLGVQSFDDDELRFLGRRHRAEESRAAVRTALEAGFETVSADLIFGLPGQRPESVRRAAAEAGVLRPHHVSAYQLTIHEGTPFERRRARGRLEELGDAEQAELYFALHAALEEAGQRAYEVSNFAASPAHRSAHNIKYWTRVDYLGLGPSAHSLRGARRWWNARAVGAWSAKVAGGESAVSGEESLTAADAALEELMLSVRQVRGLDLESFARRHGVDIRARNRERIARLEAAGLIVLEEPYLRCTLRGLAVADAIARELEVD